MSLAEKARVALKASCMLKHSGVGDAFILARVSLAAGGVAKGSVLVEGISAKSASVDIDVLKVNL